MKVSVIVIGYNGRKYLENCLNSVFDQQEISPEEYEVVFVDNASQDNSVEYVAEHFPDVKMLKLERNYGYYAAFNLAATNIAQGQYLIPLPQDTVVHRKCLSELAKVADSNQAIKICLVNTVYPRYPDFERQEREQWINWVYLMSTTRLGSTLPRRWPFSHQIVPVLACSGISVLIKRDLLDVTDRFFDTRVSHFLGDVEIGIRTNVLGYKVVLVPTAIVYHIDDNKSWSNICLLLRALEGARDTYLVYYKNMYALEFILFIPFIFIGLPLKAFGLRNKLVTQIILFAVSLCASPFVLAWAICSLPKFSQGRKLVLSRREDGAMGLFFKILKGEIL